MKIYIVLEGVGLCEYREFYDTNGGIDHIVAVPLDPRDWIHELHDASDPTVGIGEKWDFVTHDLNLALNRLYKNSAA
jgi:hypothetical protein